MKRNLIVVSLIMLMLVGMVGVIPQSSVSAQDAGAGIDVAAIDAYVGDMMAMYDVAGASIAIVKDGEVFHSAGYGIRNADTGEAVTVDTQFAIGSISKSFTALGVAQLVDQGLVDLDTPVIEYLPDFRVADEEATQTLTLRHFLSHSSGLPRADEIWYNERLTRDEIIEDMVNYELTAAPGEIYQYHNQNFVVAARVLEVVTGQTWEDYTREHIFAPLGMDGANFEVEVMQEQPNFAMPHVFDVLEGLVTIPYFDGMAAIGPSGSINANILELANYAILQLGDGTFNGETVVSSELLEEMHTEQVEGYAMGWSPSEYKDYETVWHDGGIDGFRSLLVMIPSENMGIMVLTNSSHSMTSYFTEVVTAGIFDRMVGADLEPAVEDGFNVSVSYDPDEFHMAVAAARTFEVDAESEVVLLGDYNFVGGDMSVEIQDGQLNLVVDGQVLPLVGYEPNGYLVNHPALMGTFMSFEVAEDGRVTLSQNGTSIAQKLSEDSAATDTYVDPNGLFSLEYPSEMVKQEAEGMVILTSGDPAGAFVFAAGESDGTALQADVLSFIQAFDPSFNLEPIAVETVVVNEREWTQFVYELPNNQIVAVRAFAEDGMGYVALGQGATEDEEALQLVFETLMAGFEIGVEE